MIEVRGLSYTYAGASHPAVDDISFAVAPGEIFGFLGPSGAGKSTTQKILTGLLRQYRGEVSLLGRDLRAWGSDLYAHIGVSFELPHHYAKLTGLENLRFFRSLYDGATREPSELLALVGLDESGDVYAGAYSKGMQMRLNFVRALLHDPALLFLDEPTAGLDPVNGRKIKDIVLDLQRAGKTVFLTTHDMNVADELCDRVAFIVDGRLAAVDAPRTLKLNYGVPRVRVEYPSNGAASAAEFPLEGLGANEEFLTLIRGSEIETIHTLEATLEDVFIRLTGRRLV